MEKSWDCYLNLYEGGNVAFDLDSLGYFSAAGHTAQRSFDPGKGKWAKAVLFLNRFCVKKYHNVIFPEKYTCFSCCIHFYLTVYLLRTRLGGVRRAQVLAFFHSAGGLQPTVFGKESGFLLLLYLPCFCPKPQPYTFSVHRDFTGRGNPGAVRKQSSQISAIRKFLLKYCGLRSSICFGALNLNPQITEPS